MRILSLLTTALIFMGTSLYGSDCLVDTKVLKEEGKTCRDVAKLSGDWKPVVSGKTWIFTGEKRILDEVSKSSSVKLPTDTVWLGKEDSGDKSYVFGYNVEPGFHRNAMLIAEMNPELPLNLEELGEGTVFRAVAVIDNKKKKLLKILPVVGYGDMDLSWSFPDGEPKLLAAKSWTGDKRLRVPMVEFGDRVLLFFGSEEYGANIWLDSSGKISQVLDMFNGAVKIDGKVPYLSEVHRCEAVEPGCKYFANCQSEFSVWKFNTKKEAFTKTNSKVSTSEVLTPKVAACAKATKGFVFDSDANKFFKISKTPARKSKKKS